MFLLKTRLRIESTLSIVVDPSSPFPALSLRRKPMYSPSRRGSSVFKDLFQKETCLNHRGDPEVNGYPVLPRRVRLDVWVRRRRTPTVGRIRFRVSESDNLDPKVLLPFEGRLNIRQAVASGHPV